MKSILSVTLLVAMKMGGAFGDAMNGKAFTAPIPQCIEDPCHPSCPGGSAAPLAMAQIMCCNGQNILTHADRCKLPAGKDDCCFGLCVTSSLAGETYRQGPGIKGAAVQAAAQEGEKGSSQIRSLRASNLLDI